jgi:hypothetical protein
MRKTNVIQHDIYDCFTMEHFRLRQRMTLTIKIYCSRLYIHRYSTFPLNFVVNCSMKFFQGLCTHPHRSFLTLLSSLRFFRPPPHSPSPKHETHPIKPSIPIHVNSEPGQLVSNAPIKKRKFLAVILYHPKQVIKRRKSWPPRLKLHTKLIRLFICARFILHRNA